MSRPVNYSPVLPALACVPEVLPFILQFGLLVTLCCCANSVLFGPGSLFWGSWEAGSCLYQKLEELRHGIWSPKFVTSKVRWGNWLVASAVRSYRCSWPLICIVASVQLQQCPGLLKPELPGVNQMELRLYGRWQVLQCSAGVYLGRKSRQAHKQQEREAAKSRGRNSGGVPSSSLTQTL